LDFDVFRGEGYPGGKEKVKVKILLIHPHDLFDKSEPWTIRILNLAKEFVKEGHKVKLCYFPVLLNHRYRGTVLSGIDCIPLNRAPNIFAFVKNIRRIILLAQWSDVVHFQKCHYYASLPAVLAAYLSRKPLHYDWDDWEEKIWYESCGKGVRSRFIGSSFKLLERFLPLLADSTSCASNCLMDLAEKFGVKKEFISYTPVGADLDTFRPGLNGEKVLKKYGITKNEYLILYIGQLHGAQYVDLLIRAANIILHERADVKFLITGEGFLEKQLYRLAEDLGLRHKVIFTGAVSHKEIPFYISAADVCVAPFKDTEVSRCKSPLKIVEYMASGKAIVASDVGEVHKMLGGVGLLVPSGDYHALAKGMLYLLNHKDLSSKLGLAARKRAEDKFNWSSTARNLLSAYAKITAQPR
jgi:glycosyltransferase involved in cell wall biosynthesis